MNNNSVLSYKDWLVSISNSISMTDPYSKYLEYIGDWYEDSFGGKSTEELTEDEYRNFLLTLNVVSTDQDVLSYIENLNYDNDDELRTAIPYFARNLRVIAQYISKKRETSKDTNVNYSYLGSNASIITETYKTLVEAYISNATVTGNDLLDAIGNISIGIEELYDGNEYLDKSPNIDASEYFNIDANLDFYTEMDSEFLSWTIEGGFNTLTSNNDTFNPPVSGTLPLSGYIDYDINGEQNQHFKGNLPTYLMGEQHYYLSGDDVSESMGVYSDAVKPWDNLSNRYFPTIATIPLIDSMYSKYDKGGFVIASKLGMSVALGKNKFYKSSGIEIVGDKDNFPSPSIYSNGYSFTREYQFSPIVYNSYLNWIDIKHVSGRGKGILSNDGKYQEMTPYQTTQETTSIPYLGMNQVGDKTDPWFSIEDKIWEDDVTFPPEFRNIYDIDKWYSSVLELSGTEDQWGIDIFGNNYALYKDNNFSNFYERRIDDTGKLYVRGIDDNSRLYSDFFQDSLKESLSGFGIDTLTDMNIYNDLVYLEDSDGNIMIHRIFLEDGVYGLNTAEIATTLIIEDPGDYKPFGHCFNDSTNELYVGRRETLPNSGFFEFIIYKYDSSLGRFVEVYNTRNDTSADIQIMRNDFRFDNIIDFPSISISTIDNTMMVTYVASISGLSYVVVIPIIITGTFKINEITVVHPNEDVNVAPAIESIETRHLIMAMGSKDKFTLLFEGAITDNRYLQVLSL